MNDGRIVSTDGLDLARRRLGDGLHEETRSAGPTRSRRGRRDGEAYLLGPAARIDARRRRSSIPRARRGARPRPGSPSEIRRNPFRSIVARAVELVHADRRGARHRRRLPPAGPRRACRGRRGPASPPGRPRRRAGCSSTATSSTSAGGSRPPRSCRRRARTRPPSRPTCASSRRRSCTCRTTQATHRLEQLIRSYDPCISCATHFLDLLVEGPHERPRAVRSGLRRAERGDDAAARRRRDLLAGLPRTCCDVLDVRRCEQLDLDDLIDCPRRACVIVDAVVGVRAGEVVTIPLAELPERDAAAGPVPRSSHVLPIGHARAHRAWSATSSRGLVRRDRRRTVFSARRCPRGARALPVFREAIDAEVRRSRGERIADPAPVRRWCA